MPLRIVRNDTAKPYQIDSQLVADIAAYIDKEYVRTYEDRPSEKRRPKSRMQKLEEYAAYECEAVLSAGSLEEALDHMGESFAQMVLRKIDEEHITDAQCYKKANMDRKLFSKIRSKKDYKPSKNTALALGIALELPLPEFSELLEKAGYAFSPSDKGDIIIRYFVEKGQYNIYEINAALFAFQQKQVGA